MHIFCFNSIISLLRQGIHVRLGFRQNIVAAGGVLSNPMEGAKNALIKFFGTPTKNIPKRLIDPNELFFKPLPLSSLPYFYSKCLQPIANPLSLKAVQESLAPCILRSNRLKYLNFTKGIADKALAEQKGLLAYFRHDPSLSERISCSVHQVSIGQSPKEKLLEFAIGKFTKECVGFVEQHALCGLLQDPNLIDEDLTKRNLEKICPNLLLENPDLPLHLETKKGREAAVEVLKGSNSRQIGIINRDQIAPLIRSLYPEVDRCKEKMRFILVLTTLMSFIWFATFTSLIDPVHKPRY